MNTKHVAGFIQLVCLLLLTGIQKGKGGYDAIVDMKIGATAPDPNNLFASGAKADLYLTAPQINANQDLYVTAKITFRDRETGNLVAVSQAMFSNLSFSLTGINQQGGVQYVVSSNLINISNSTANGVYTDRTSASPNPTASGAWVYGLDTCGCLVTPIGRTIKDPNAAPYDGGEFMVDSTPNLKVAEFWIVGARRKLPPNFVNAFSNLRSTGLPFNLRLEVTHNISIDSVLSVQHGCKSSPTYLIEQRLPTVWAGTEQGPAKLALEIINPTTFLLQNAHLSSVLIQESPDEMKTWHTIAIPAAGIIPQPNGDTVFTIPSPALTLTHPQPNKCFFRAVLP
jgi:hypothetical protein